jgi:hypothetical protein
MSYDPSIPSATSSPAVFPAQCQTNWGRLQTIVSSDHQFNLGAATNDGYHNLVHMQIPSTLPTGALSSLGRLYVNTAGSYVQLFYMDSNGRSYQITPGILAAVNFDGTGANGFQTIRSQTNVTSVNKTGTGKYTINFTTAINNNNYVVSLTGMRDSANSISNGQVSGNATYGTSVSTTALEVQFNGGSSGLNDVLMGNVLIYAVS